MGKAGRPRYGSMGVWPRVRAKKTVARVRSVPVETKVKPLAFATYKAGMTHTHIIGQEKNKRSFNQTTSVPVTILECPPMKIASLRLYKKNGTALVVSKQLNFKMDKEMVRKQKISKKDARYLTATSISEIKADDFKEITVQVYTTPKSIALKKKPELFEVKLGGTNQEKLDWIKEHIDKPITISDVFAEGQLVDVHAVTKGKGYQGPMKRFGIGRTQHKSEKAKRNPGSLGGWKAQAHVMYRIAHAGQMGYHQRTQYNNLVMKISDKPEEVKMDGGIVRYGDVKTTYLLIKGSVAGAKKRLITLSEPIRPKEKPKFSSESIKLISTKSQQGR